MFSGLITAIRTLTIFPIFGKETKPFYYSLVWFPFVGLFLFSLIAILIYGGLIYGATQHLSAEISSFLAVCFLVIFTRGLHLDGLADLADGFFGAYEKEKILKIMKDSSIGTFGGVALILALLGKVLLFAEAIRVMEKEHFFLALLMIGLLSRGGMSILAASFSYARETGTAEHFIQQAGKKEYLTSAFWMFGFSTLLFGVEGAIICLAYLILTHLFGFWCTRKIGGITGDVLGAWAELSELLLLLGFSLLSLQLNTGFLVRWIL